MKRPRLTIGAALVVIAAFACGFAALRIPSEARAVEIATRRFLRDGPAATRGNVGAVQSSWDPKKRRWIISFSDYSRGDCIYGYEIGPMGSCEGGLMFCR